HVQLCSAVGARCTCSSRYNSCISFHCFPADNAARQQWLAKIQRDNFTPNRDTRVCSRHFLPGDIVLTLGKRLLKRGAVPVLFEWNNYSSHEPRPSFHEHTASALRLL
uniref:THAP domain-containing protein 1 n=1 Tax=Gouania willdenowi TaxID=441366 RepID=A0A8C5DCU0_GOUWI